MKTLAQLATTAAGSPGVVQTKGQAGPQGPGINGGPHGFPCAEERPSKMKNQIKTYMKKLFFTILAGAVCIVSCNDKSGENKMSADAEKNIAACVGVFSVT